MAFSKIILNNTTLMDVTQKTVTSGSMLSGTTALKNDGTDVTGSIATKTSSDMTASTLTVTAPAGYYASDASKTLTDANLIAGNIKKDISIFGVTGTLEGGGSGLVYESGTYTPASDMSSTTTISFQNQHTIPPFFYAVYNINTQAIDTSYTAIGCAYFNFGLALGGSVGYGSKTVYGYAIENYSSNSTPLTGTGSINSSTVTTAYNDTESSAKSNSQYWATSSAIKVSSGTRTYKAGRTYKWIAVWAPTT